MLTLEYTKDPVLDDLKRRVIDAMRNAPARSIPVVTSVDYEVDYNLHLPSSVDTDRVGYHMTVFGEPVTVLHMNPSGFLGTYLLLYRTPVERWVRSFVMEISLISRYSFPMSRDILYAVVERNIRYNGLFMQFLDAYRIEERAYRLFIRYLNERQYHDWRTSQKLYLRGSDGAMYRMGRGSFNVSGVNHDGSLLGAMCFVPHNASSIPEYDVYTSQFLMLKYEAKKVLSIANFRSYS